MNLEYDMLSFVNFSRSALRDDPQISTSETQAQPRLVTSGRAGRVWKSIEKRHYYPHSFFQVSGFACRLWLISFRDNEQCLFKEDGDSQRNDMSTSVIVPSQLSRPSTGSITLHTIPFTLGAGLARPLVCLDLESNTTSFEQESTREYTTAH